jgi:membrane protein DedA with SNARE-associated domain
MDAFFAWFESIQPAWMYMALGVSAYVENVFPPIPGDTVLVFGAYLVGRDVIRMDLTMVVTTFGSLLGFLTCYAAGRWLDRRFIHKYMGLVFSEERYLRVEQWFQRYGYWVIGINRFLSGMRSVIAVAAGISGLRGRWVALLGLFSAAIWNGLLISIGSSVGSNWEVLSGYLQEYNRIVGLVLLTALSIGLLLYILQKNGNNHT